MNSANVAVVFSGQNTLDQTDMRLGVLRIPEVTQKLREAQTLIEKITQSSVDLRAALLVEEKEYLSKPKLRSLLCAIVQIGLFERWSKLHSKPSYLIGHSNLDSALQVASGRKNLEDIVKESALFKQKDISQFLAAQSTPILGGVELVEYEVSILDRSSQQYIAIRSREMDVLRLFSYVADQLPLDEIVNFGPGCALFSNYNKILSEKKILVSDSIYLDPMLDWFWNSIRPVDAISQ